jgi:hypothetical protein
MKTKGCAVMNNITKQESETLSCVPPELDIVSLVADIEASKNRNPVVATENIIDRIKRLHCEAASHYLIALGKAIEIGQLLVEQKEKLKHGEFMPWIEKNMPFSTATARNYMKLWRNRETLKMLNVSNLKMAYKVTQGSGPVMMPCPQLDSPFASVRYPDPFSHCDDEQKRKWLAEWILHVQDGIHPEHAWGAMEWTVARYTFDEYFDETKGAKYFGTKKPPKEVNIKAKKRVNDFFEQYKGVDLLKLKFTCLSLVDGYSM